MELQPLSSGSQGMMWNLWVCADFADFLTSGPSAARIPGSAQEQFAFYFSCLKIRSMLELFLYKITNSIHSSPPKTEKRSNISAAAIWYISAPTAISIAISLIISISLIFSDAILTEEQGHSSSSNVDLGLTEARHRNPPDPVVQYTRIQTMVYQYSRIQPHSPRLPTHTLEYSRTDVTKLVLWNGDHVQLVQ